MNYAVATIPTEGEMTALNMLGKALAESKYFKDASDPGKAIVKILYGKELGLGPVQSLLGIDFQAQGGLSLRAHTIAALIRKSGRYDYRVTKGPDKDGCEIDFFEIEWDGHGTAEGPKKKLNFIGKSSFGPEDAARAGLNLKTTYKQHPSDMYYNRALAKGARWHCPDVFGSPVYVEGELGPATRKSIKATDELDEIADEPIAATGVVVEAKDTQEMPNESLKATIEALGATPETVPESLAPDPDPAPLNPTPEEQEIAKKIIEESDKIAAAKVNKSTGELNFVLVAGDIIPVKLAERIEAQAPGSTLSNDDLNDFHAHLSDFLGGGEKGRKAARAAWSKVGVEVKKGVTVTREQAMEVMFNVNGDME